MGLAHVLEASFKQHDLDLVMDHLEEFATRAEHLPDSALGFVDPNDLVVEQANLL